MPSLRIAVSSSKRIEGTDISRSQVKLQLFEGSSTSVKTKPVERTDPCNSTSDRPKAEACLKSDLLRNDNEQQETKETEGKRLRAIKTLHLKGTSLMRSEERLEK